MSYNDNDVPWAITIPVTAACYYFLLSLFPAFDVHSCHPLVTLSLMLAARVAKVLGQLKFQILAVGLVVGSGHLYGKG